MPLSHRVPTHALPRLRLSKATKKWRQSRNTSTAPAVEQVDHFVPSPPQSQPPPSRAESIRNAAPFSAFLTDSHARQHNYLRISLTERCNLRCTYCMPSEGVPLSPDREILTTPEIVYLSSLFVSQGVTKIRLTGGEPTVRKDILPLMQQIGSLSRNGLKELALTTNGISLHRKLEGMVEAGLTGVNISLDTLDPLQFPILTRRNGFEAVMRSIDRVKELNRAGAGIKLKINIVAMRGVNDNQIIPFVAMTETEDLEVRFIEYMPFGGNKWSQKKMLPYEKIRETIQEKWPTFERMRDEKNAVSKTWRVPGFVGRVGFITSMTEDFCGTCNRLRITSDGNLKVCLHGNTEVSLRDLLRSEREGEPMNEAAFEALRQLELQRRGNGGEGWITKEQQLLDVIGAAVKRKKAKHAGMGELEKMENRPMILIGKRNAKSLSRPSSFQPSSWSSSPYRSPNRNVLGSGIPLQLLHAASSQLQARCYSSTTDKADSRFYEYFEQATDDGKGSDVKDQGATRSLDKDSSDNMNSVGPGFEAPWTNSEPQSQQTSAEPSQIKTPSEEVESKSPQVSTQAESSYEATSSAIPASISPPAFGFQSLSGLFQRPAPSDRQAEEYKFMKDIRSDWSEPREDTQGWSLRKPNDNSFIWSSNSSLGNIRLRAKTAKLEAGNWSVGRPGEQSPVPSLAEDLRTDSALSAAEVQPSDAPLENGKQAPPPRLERRRPNPFESSSASDGGIFQEGIDYKRITPPGLIQTKAERPWGLSVQDAISVNSFLEPGSQGVSEDSTPDANTPTKRTKAKSTDATRTVVGSTASSTEGQGTAKLTHVTSTGEAQMVDVGAKDSTRRVAIAFGTVQFTNPETYRLIKENANKKGDVLGVARIAGIMAAKRTSEIIPLCHPLALTKVEVDLTLHRKGSDFATLSRLSKHDLVAIQTLVECTGPTGVEMEALSALSGAALTVFDMCKAVDRKMQVGPCRVVYKSGGRSGLHSMPEWVKLVGKDFFVERGLEQHGRAVQTNGNEESAKGHSKDRSKRSPQQGRERSAEPSSLLQQRDSVLIRRVAAPDDSPVETLTSQAEQARKSRKESYESLWTPSPSSPIQSPSNPTPTGDERRKFSELHTTTEQTASHKYVARPKICRQCSMELPSRAKLFDHLVAEHGWIVESKGESERSWELRTKGALRKSHSGEGWNLICRPPISRTKGGDEEGGEART